MGQRRSQIPIVCLIAGAALVGAALPASACGSVDLGGGRVTAIPDRRTFVLDDGRLVKLAAIEWAVPPDAAQAALSGLILNRTVSLKGSAVRDRYGRIHAFAFVSGSETPIQYQLLEQGSAIMGTRSGDKACTAALLARENVARAARAGVWNATDRRHHAEAPDSVLRDRGRFAIVEGRVLSVRESGGIIYVNFGRRWSEDFTVTIAKRNEQTFITGGLPPRSLSGRDVRVRGFVEERAGPWIEATRPEQFELTPVSQKGN